MAKPFRGGQAVRWELTGEIGITVDEPKKRSPEIAVQLIDRHYPVYLSLDEVEVIELEEVK